MGITISQLSAEIGRLQKLTEQNKEKVMGAVAKRTADIAKEEVLLKGAYEDGDLYNGIITEQDGSRIIVHSTAPHSAYVEFGTGVVGQNAPHHPNVAISWAHDVNEHGHTGWRYTDNGVSRWTKGMPSRPFMWDAAQEMKNGELGITAQKEWGKL